MAALFSAEELEVWLHGLGPGFASPGGLHDLLHGAEEASALGGDVLEVQQLPVRAERPIDRLDRRAGVGHGAEGEGGHRHVEGLGGEGRGLLLGGENREALRNIPPDQRSAAYRDRKLVPLG